MEKGRILRASVVGAAVLLGGSILAPTAWADSVTFTLANGNSPGGLGNFPGPYATVTVNLIDPTDATITFDSLSATGGACAPTGCTYLMASDGAAAVNVNAASWTLNSVTGSNSGTGFTPGPFSNGGAGNEDGFGSFNQTINSFDGYQHSSNEIILSLTDTSGTWASAANVLIGNADGNVAAIHGFAASCPSASSCVASGTGATPPLGTGFATTPGPVLGAGLPGLVAACFGLIGLARRRRQRIA